jgi:hypothetical protein
MGVHFGIRSDAQGRAQGAEARLYPAIEVRAVRLMPGQQVVQLIDTNLPDRFADGPPYVIGEAALTAQHLVQARADHEQVHRAAILSSGVAVRQS